MTEAIPYIVFTLITIFAFWVAHDANKRVKAKDIEIAEMKKSIDRFTTQHGWGKEWEGYRYPEDTLNNN